VKPLRVQARDREAPSHQLVLDMQRYPGTLRPLID
jgi:hypothetical protein